MRLLGIDPSITCTGYSIYDIEENNFLSYNYITTKSLSNYFDKALLVSSELFKEANMYSVDKIIFEGYAFGSRKFGGHNHNLIEFIGIIKYILLSSYLGTLDDLIIIPPKTARKLVLNNGNADKEMIYNYFNTTYKLNFNPSSKIEKTRIQNITDSMILCIAYKKQRSCDEK